MKQPNARFDASLQVASHVALTHHAVNQRDMQQHWVLGRPETTRRSIRRQELFELTYLYTFASE
jgi:hypothetical protein